jgi:hypothetical protein
MMQLDVPISEWDATFVFENVLKTFFKNHGNRSVIELKMLDSEETYVTMPPFFQQRREAFSGCTT